MSIIKLSEPWCVNIEELTEGEIEELQNYFVKASVNYNYGWTNAKEEQIYVGITSDGLSDYFDCVSSFDKEDEDSNNVTVYTIKQLRAIMAEHLAKPPVEKLEDGVVYYVYTTLDEDWKYLAVNNKAYINLNQEALSTAGESWESEFKNKEGYIFTKATPAQIAHYEACVKAGKYVEPESVTEFVVGKWYEVIDNSRLLYGKFLRLKGKNFVSSNDIGLAGEGVFSGNVYEWTLSFSNIPLEDLSEIQEFLPDGHPDKVVKPKSERYIATMKFFEQLREPERSEAIANYDESFSEYVPENLYNAISYGFDFCKVPKDFHYWNDLRYMIDENTYFKEELLVFGKYKVGDIVVCVSGNIMCISSSSTKHRMSTDIGVFTARDEIKPATPEEVEAYNQGVRNIADIKPKDYKEAVHCTTQEEWDFVLDTLAYIKVLKSNFEDYTEDSYIDTNEQSYGNVYGSGTEYDTILTFKQWCEKYSHFYEVVPEYVECVETLRVGFTRGKIYTWPNPTYDCGDTACVKVLNGHYWKFKPSTKEAYDKQQEKLKMEELLIQAKRRYPAGTKFYPAHINNCAKEDWVIIPENFEFIINKVNICAYSDGRRYDKNHSCVYNRVVYNKGKWAEIVKEEPKVTEIKPVKGMYVRCLKQNTWGDGKTEVGQVLKIEDVSSYGDMWINNQSLAIQRIQRREFELLPDYRKEPWVAQVGDWVYVLDASNSCLYSGDIVRCDYISNSGHSAHFETHRYNETSPNSYLQYKHYRKATQEEIDSVTKTTATNTQTEWTADNWYVEVTSQEEADTVIDAAAKMYGKGIDKQFTITTYHRVGIDDTGDYCLIAHWQVGNKKPRPITDFIQKSGIITGDLHKSWVEKQVDAIIAGRYVHNSTTKSYLVNLEKGTIEPCKPQQDELVIYKPEQTRLVEPGAVSASASTTNLIIKSNSKYL